MAASPLGIAFLGCGLASRIHAKQLRRFDGVRRFYASRERAKAEEYLKRFGGEGAFGSYEEAIADPRVDAVVVATPPRSHLELTRAALAAGKHVVVEKPPFLSTADFDAVRAARDAAGRRVMIAENYFYKPVAEALRRIIADGDVGEPRILSVNALKEQKVSGWRGDAGLMGGGALFEGGIHWVNFMANLGLKVDSVDGFRPGEKTGPDRTMVLVFRYAGGAVGTLYYSWEIGSRLNGLHLSAVHGSEGSVTFESNGVFLRVRGRRRSFRVPLLTDLPGYRGMWRDFVPALRENREPRFDFDLARRDLELVEAAYRTAEARG
ncbi:MAG TPA: Gfo/Idh/MocA family oxidoreductase [Longimicrobium sp.]|nr:Gfo/Idh/MocA family oxidoreductase [Longimicrobium sp.]